MWAQLEKNKWLQLEKINLLKYKDPGRLSWEIWPQSFMLKIITRIKMHIGGQEDFNKYDNGHTVNVLELI